MTGKRSAKWDNVKFFLIFLVVLGHAMEIFCKNFSAARSLFIFIYSFHMPAFIFVSGMFSKRTVNSERFRAERIVPFIPLWILLHFFRNAGLYIYNNNRSFSLLDQNNIAWFMLAMFVFQTLSWALRKRNRKLVLLFSVILSILAGFVKAIGPTLSLSRLFVFYPFFLLGIMTEREDLEEIFRKPSVKRASVIFLLGVFVLTFVFEPECYRFRRMFTGQNSYYLYPGGFKSTNWIIRLILYPFSLLMCFSFFCIIPEKKAFYTDAGKHTLSIYFWHLPFLTALYHLDFIKEISMKSGLSAIIVGLAVSLLLVFIFNLKPFVEFTDLFFKAGKYLKKTE